MGRVKKELQLVLYGTETVELDDKEVKAILNECIDKIQTRAITS